VEANVSVVAAPGSGQEVNAAALGYVHEQPDIDSSRVGLLGNSGGTRLQPDIDSSRVGLLGHSEGAAIAAMVAARNSDVSFVISMAGTALPYSEVVLRQVELIAEASGLPADEVALMRERQVQAMRYVEAGEWEKVHEIVRTDTLERIAGLPGEQAAALGDPDEPARQQADAQVAGMQTPWMQFFISHDPRPDWERITVPVLAVFGGLDTQVEAAQNRPALEEACGAPATATLP